MPISPTDVGQRRVDALREYAIMDTTPEQGFDDISRLTSFICGTPIATITLLDLHRQWFKARIGLDKSETPLSESICATAIQQKDLFLVHDTQQDQRFADYACVTGAPHIRFYAGAPLITPEGVPLGTLCAIDREPRHLTPEQKEALTALARQVMTMLELRRTVKALDVTLAAKLAAEAEVDTLRDLLPMCAWCRKVRDDDQLWQGLEEYFTQHYADTRISHGICPDCAVHFQKEMRQTSSQGRS